MAFFDIKDVISHILFLVFLMAFVFFAVKKISVSPVREQIDENTEEEIAEQEEQETETDESAENTTDDAKDE